MRHSPNYHERSEAAHRVARRCRRCGHNYSASDQDPNDLCLCCAHDKDFERRVAEWFIRNPFAAFEVFTHFDERRVRVILTTGRTGLNSTSSTPHTPRRCGGDNRERQAEAQVALIGPGELVSERLAVQASGGSRIAPSIRSDGVLLPGGMQSRRLGKEVSGDRADASQAASRA